MAQTVNSILCPQRVGDLLGDQAPQTLTALGDPAILRNPLLGLFSSIKCPGDLILKTYDLARDLRDRGVTVIGGFHSPMERDCRDILLKGKQPLVICPARSIEKMMIPRPWRPAIDQGRLLILSPFSPEHPRATARLAEQRNLLCAALASTIFIAHAQANSKTLSLALTALAWHKPVHTFDHPANGGLVALGVSSSAHDLFGRLEEEFEKRVGPKWVT